MTPKKLKPNTAGIVQQCMSASRKFLSENKRYPSIRELSIALGISEGTAKYRVNMIKERLRIDVCNWRADVSQTNQ